MSCLALGSSHSLHFLLSNLWHQLILVKASTFKSWIWTLFLSANTTYSIAYEMFLLTGVSHGFLKVNISPAELTLFFISYSHFQSSPTVWQVTFKPEPGELSRAPTFPLPPSTLLAASLWSPPLQYLSYQTSSLQILSSASACFAALMESCLDHCKTLYMLPLSWVSPHSIPSAEIPFKMWIRAFQFPI